MKYLMNLPEKGLYKQAEVITIAAGADADDSFTVETGRGDTKALSISCAGKAGVVDYDFFLTSLRVNANGASIIQSDTLLRWSANYANQNGIYLPIEIKQGGTVQYTIKNQSLIDMGVEIELWWYQPDVPILGSAGF